MGVYISELAYSYEGEWREGLRHGEGTEQTVPPGASGKYTGQFLADLRHGEGTMHYDTGGVFEGEWRAGLRQGKGVEVFVSGGRYEGEFFRDLFNGHGLYTVPPITRAERLRAYVMRMLFAAEQVLG